ncbi:MAG: hypothetical protein QT03_C0001G0971 [archaeon GW2011_AR10]|uniref:Uncharacterized protein n=1 Tax=Candidatus Iainarchaeum sp. TaxID=3101447 RepID=A0A7J4IVQ8_9ARCH|nr:MAG: hypothetical protein QT03_C0001G0971 [archaeon GW2011_AR10]HIH08439.1 hypothetical protein [Candidatus Diapherotrites archaeon]
MRQKSVVVEEEKPYSKRDFERLEAACRRLEKNQKDPDFRKAVKQFIKETT